MDSPGGSASLVQEDGSRKKPHRARVACTRCRSQKLRCDGLIPCSRCIRANVPCADPLERTRRRLSSRDEHAHTLLRLSSATAQTKPAHGQISPVPESNGREVPIDPRFVRRLQADLKGVVSRLEAVEARVGIAFNADPLSAGGDHDQPPLRSASMHESVRAPFTDMMEKGADESNLPSRGSSPELVQPYQSATVNGNDPRQPADSGIEDRSELDTVRIELARVQRASEKAPASAYLAADLRAADPISRGLISNDLAAWLLDWFLEHCHPFLPVLDAGASNKIARMREESPFLLTVILAIGLRFDALRTCRLAEAGGTTGLSDSLTQMTEVLLGQTLLRSRFRLSDVQAVLFLHAWGLRPIGQGSDPWILSGHAFRLAKRLGVEKTVTSSHSFGRDFLSSRRTWLLLCASDCFPSLGFGRPFSPKENLDLCAHIIASLKQDHLFKGIDIGPDAFVAAQGELAQISRRLLDWVADASSQLNFRSNKTHEADDSSWIDVDSIWTRYQELSQSLQMCEAQWDEGLQSPVANASAALYRWHVRLCLPSFALRLNDIADRTSIARSRAQDLASGRETGSKASRFRSIYHQAILRSSEAIVRLHAQDEEGMLTYVPDYLVMALAQACSARIGLLESGLGPDKSQRRRAAGGERGTGRQTGGEKRETELVASALASLDRLATQGVSLARYLSAKVVDAAKKARLAIPQRSDFRHRKAAATEVEATKPAKRPRRNARPCAGERGADSGSVNNAIINDGPSWAAAGETSGQHMDPYISPAASSLQDLLEVRWPEADDLDLWFDADDPLRLLFGENADLLAPGAFDLNMDLVASDS